MKAISGLQVVVALVRFYSAMLLFDSVTDLSFLPERLFMAAHPRDTIASQYAGTVLIMFLLRIAARFIVGIALLIGAWPLARMLAKSEDPLEQAV